ncbi:MAG: RNase adapter RapZ [Deltaproteobacteria bacterium]|nr:RNase adapter RapZ [Deltaproteobacteria bacterium]
MEQQKIVIITGLSGSGKSTAMKALEDAGFFCVDNLPIVLLPAFLRVRIGQSWEVSNLALIMDIREKTFVSRYPEVFNELKGQGYQFEIIFLEASENDLIRRYSQTRRQHPLAREKGLLEGIRAEKAQLQDLREIADIVIDTSNCNVHELRAIVLRHVLKQIHGTQIQVLIQSFGFKFGIPREADLIMDVRFLPNPYFVPELKELDGTTAPVELYVKQWDQTRIFIDKYLDLLDFLLPLYEEEGKSYLTVAIGCTGGRHRSVVVAHEVFEHLKGKLKSVHLTHRDIELG